MKTQYFLYEEPTAKKALEKLCDEIDSFLEAGEEVVSLSHALMQNEEKQFVASAVMCYKDPVNSKSSSL